MFRAFEVLDFQNCFENFQNNFTRVKLKLSMNKLSQTAQIKHK